MFCSWPLRKVSRQISTENGEPERMVLNLEGKGSSSYTVEWESWQWVSLLKKAYTDRRSICHAYLRDVTWECPGIHGFANSVWPMRVLLYLRVLRLFLDCIWFLDWHFWKWPRTFTLTCGPKELESGCFCLFVLLLLILCGFYIMNFNPIYLPLSSSSPSALVTSLLK